MPSGLRLRQALLSLLVFASLTLAALQNVTVDDAVLVGPVVPEYLPSGYWDLAPNCMGCAVMADPSQAYNGTWHETLYNPGPNQTSPQLNFSFTGSAIYIYFILDNATPTAVNFILDGVIVGTFAHIGSGINGYQYNVSVYANNTLPFGLHNMIIEPPAPEAQLQANIIFFDYLIYTMNVTEPSGSVPSPTSSPSQTPSASSTMSMSMGNVNIGTISGAVVGVVVAVLLVAAGGFLWYRRYKKRKQDLSQSANQVMIEDSPLPTPVTIPVPFRDTPSPDQQRIQNNRFAKQKSGSRTDVSSPTGSAPNSPSSPATSISPSPSGGAVHGLLEQVELLREEVAHLVRHQRNEEGGSIYEANPLPPPQYSDNTDGTRR